MSHHTSAQVPPLNIVGEPQIILEHQPKNKLKLNIDAFTQELKLSSSNKKNSNQSTPGSQMCRSRNSTMNYQNTSKSISNGKINNQEEAVSQVNQLVLIQERKEEVQSVVMVGQEEERENRETQEEKVQEENEPNLNSQEQESHPDCKLLQSEVAYHLQGSETKQEQNQQQLIDSHPQKHQQYTNQYFSDSSATQACYHFPNNMTFPLSSEDEQVLSHTEGTYKAIQLHTVAMLQSSQESQILRAQIQTQQEREHCYQAQNHQQFQRLDQPHLMQPGSDTSSIVTPKNEEQIICDNSRAQQRMEIMKQQIQEIKKRQEELIKVEEVDDVVQLNLDLVLVDQKYINPNLMQIQQSQAEEFSTKQSSTLQLNQKQTIDSRYKTLQLNPNSSQQSFQPMQILSGKASTKYNLLKNVIEQSFQSKGAVGKSSSLEGRTLGTTHSIQKNHYSTLQPQYSQHETRSVAHPPVINLENINSSHYSTVQPSPHQHQSMMFQHQQQQQNFDIIQHPTSYHHHYQSQQQQQTIIQQQEPPLISQILQNKQQPDNSVLLQEIALLQQREAILQHQLQKAKRKAEKERVHWEQQMGHMQQEVGQLNQLINELMQEKMTTGGQQPYRCKCKTKIRDLERQVLDLHRQLYFAKREQQPQQPSFICNNMMSPKNNNLSAIIGAADITPSQNQSKKKSRLGSEAQRSNNKSRSRSKTPQAQSLNQSGIAPQRSKSRSQSRSINNSKCEQRTRSKERKIVTSPKQIYSTTKQMKENTQLLNNKGPRSANKRDNSKEKEAKMAKTVKNSMKKVISIPKIRNDDSLPTLEQLKHMKANTLAKEVTKSKQQKALTK